jgi:hypothetical protein
LNVKVILELPGECQVMLSIKSEKTPSTSGVSIDSVILLSVVATVTAKNHFGFLFLPDNQKN